MLYIRVENGQTVDHPVFADNLMQVYGQIPSNYEPFNRLPPPRIGVIQTFDHEAIQYAKVDDVWQDLWPVKMRSDEEIETIRKQFREDITKVIGHQIEHLDSLKEKCSDQEIIDGISNYQNMIRNIDVSQIEKPEEYRIPQVQPRKIREAVHKLMIVPKDEQANTVKRRTNERINNR